MDYNLTVAYSGTYSVKFRVATSQVHAQFQILVGTTVVGTINVPNTGDWVNWSTITLDGVSLSAGAQTIRILSTNNESCNFNWFEFVAAGNQPPTAVAGQAQTIILPTSQVSLSGSGIDADGSVVSYAWTQTAGTAATITNAAAASTTVTGLTTAGARTFRLTVTDNEGATATNDVIITVNAPGPPTANAGTNKVVTLPTSQTTLTGSGTANNGGGSITGYAWTQVGGTAATIVNASSATTNITGLTTAGTRTFRLTVTDNLGATGTSDVTVSVNTPAAPTANAGSAQIITLPTSQATLTGSGTANNGGSITGYAWTQVGGTAATIVSASSATTNITGLTTTGVRTFRLTVTDNNGSTGTSDVTVTVNPLSNGKTIPGKIEAESWDAKSGPFYAVATADAGGGSQVVGITNGSWMDYNVTVATAGTYTVNFRVATTQAHAQFQVKSGNTVLGTINIPNTGDWSNWSTVSVSNIVLAAAARRYGFFQPIQKPVILTG
ncbi:MAG: carbohydrate-binding protein, partial [Chitinophagaceae bacterium]